MKLSCTLNGSVDTIRDEEGIVLFVVRAGHGAEAIRLQHIAWEQQAKRRYTAAARLSAQVEQLPGYEAKNYWKETSR